MDLIILNDGLFQLIPVTKEILDGIVLTSEMDCMDLCNILREKLSGYADTLNLHRGLPSRAAQPDRRPLKRQLRLPPYRARPTGTHESS